MNTNGKNAMRIRKVIKVLGGRYGVSGLVLVKRARAVSDGMYRQAARDRLCGMLSVEDVEIPGTAEGFMEWLLAFYRRMEFAGRYDLLSAVAGVMLVKEMGDALSVFDELS